MNRSKTITKGVLTLALASFAIVTMGVEIQLDAVQMNSDFTLAGGGSVTYVPEGANSIQVTFVKGDPLAGGGLQATVVVDRDVTDSPFRGDYTTLSSLRANVTSSAASIPVMLQWRLESGARIWYCSMALNAVSEAQIIDVPLALSAGWWTDSRGDKAAMFAEDLQNVSCLKIELQPAGSPSTQSYILANVVAVSDSGIVTPPGTLSPLEQALIARFGVGYSTVDSLTEEMRQFDTDGDGMADYVEIWAENDQLYADSIFAAEIVEVATAGVTIKWSAVAGKVYTVLRSGALPGAFLPVPGLMSLTADETGFKVEVDPSAAVGEGPFYYRILRHE